METNEKTTRRINLTLCTPSELAIRKAINEIEKLGTDVKLTEAIIKLSEAKTIVSDFIDKRIGL